MSDFAERFWAKVDKRGPTDCWEWTAHRNALGYGRFGVGSRTDGSARLVRAHRVAYELVVGPIPEGLELDHLCRNPGCVNPAHLEAVTHRENILRGVGLSAENAAKTECKRGHALSGANLYLTPRGCRHCRRCRRDAQRRYRARHA